MDKITLHGFAHSTYTRTARMAGLEKGVGIELTPIPFGEPGHLTLHPFGRMPAMTHGGLTLFETLAIVSYIDDAFSGPRLIPEPVDLRARVLGAISAGIDYAYRPIVHLAERDTGFDPDDLAKANRVLDWLERSSR